MIDNLNPVLSGESLAATAVIAELQRLVEKHGDLPVVVGTPEGDYYASTPSFRRGDYGRDEFVL